MSFLNLLLQLHYCIKKISKGRETKMTLAELLNDRYKLNEEHMNVLDSVLKHFHKYGGEHEAYNLDDLKEFVFKLEVIENLNLNDSIDVRKLNNDVDEKYNYYYDLALYLCKVGILQYTKTRQQEWFVLNELLRDTSFYKELSVLRMNVLIKRLNCYI